VLTFSSTPSGDLVIATPRGLWISDAAPRQPAAEKEVEPSGTLLPWESIVTAKWSADALTVVAAEEIEPQIMKRVPAIILRLRAPEDVPRVVRLRVDRSVVVSRRHAVGAGSTVLIVGRRISGQDGLRWYAVFDRDSDADDPDLRREATNLLMSTAAQSMPEL